MANTIDITSEYAADPHHMIDPILERNVFLDKVIKPKSNSKIFRPEEAIITSMKKDGKFKFMYNFIVAIWFWLVVESACDDYYRYQRIYFMTRTLKIGFNKLHWAFLIWGVMQLVATIFYYAFQLWSSVRKRIRNNRVIVLFWDYASLATFIIFQLLFLISGQCAVFMVEFNVGTGFALALENVRFIMKMHAFVRTNAPMVLTMEKLDFGVKKYLYFLFAPTLLYRSSYPRTQRIRWRVVFVNFLEFFGALFFICYYYERHLRPTYHNLGEVKVSAIYLLKSFFFTTLSCALLYVTFFYAMFQGWFNFFAELLRFADRRFYAEWWEVDDYTQFYRKWNLVIQEWLHEFIYQDLKRYCSKLVLRYIITFVSAVVHEIILLSVLRFFYPVIFILIFFCSNIVVNIMPYVLKNIRATIFWILFNLGISVWLFLYLLEHRARANCTVEDNWRGFFIPVSWNCIF